METFNLTQILLASHPNAQIGFWTVNPDVNAPSTFDPVTSIFTPVNLPNGSQFTFTNTVASAISTSFGTFDAESTSTVTIVINGSC